MNFTLTFEFILTKFECESVDRHLDKPLASLLSGRAYRIDRRMKKLSWTNGLVAKALLLTIAISGSNALAQDSSSAAETTALTDNAAAALNSEQPTPKAQVPVVAGSDIDQTAILERLEFIQAVLTTKLLQRSALGEKIELANEQDKEDLRRKADGLTVEIDQLRTTLENIAIGGLDTSLFVNTDKQEKGDWRKDMALIAEPVIDSLKELTEKPRKLAALNDSILLHQEEINTAKKALANLQPTLELSTTGELGSSIERINKQWQGRLNDATSSVGIAQIQIAELQGKKALTESLFDAIVGFLTGRGLTIVLALLAAAAVWFSIRFLLRGYRASLSTNTESVRKTRYRLAAYSVHVLTFVLILIAVFAVFYERGDVLLLGLLILLVVGLALGIRHLLPRYVSEARLLLNIGAMRENERILYRNLPWRVESINMYTTLKNPELEGEIRIPLAEFHGISSRSTGADSWFPTSQGDVILLPDDTVLEVVRQNPDTVELKQRGGQIVTVPSTDFYTQSMVNLTRGGSFGVSSTFGVDYEHQAISLTHIPKVLADSVSKTLTKSGLDTHVKNVEVELKEANTSSLDYWIFVTCHSDAAHAYLDIQRLIQRACIDACTTESLNIPFPHIALVQKSSSTS